jgi:F0F1-type ATP synthase assembly protein I
MSRGDGGRVLSSRGLLCQAGVVAVAGLAASIWGRYAGYSALAGAAVAWVTTLYMRRRALVPARSVDAALRQVMVGELVKVLATIALFAVAARVPHTVWPALLCGYATALVASWLAPVPGMGANDGLIGRATRSPLADNERLGL